MNVRILACFFLVFSVVSCVSQKKYNSSVTVIEKLRNDSILLEKRAHMLQDKVVFLENKNATTEQALTQRLQEKEDSLNLKQHLLKEQENSIIDMKARKAEEREAFTKLSASVIRPFQRFETSDIVTGTNCTETVVEVSDRMLFLPHSSKIDQSKAGDITDLVAQALKKHIDLKLMIVCHTDSLYAGKEKWEDNWALGTAKANTLARYLVREYRVDPSRIIPATQAEYIALNKLNKSLGKSRTAFLFYSELLPCVHTTDE